MFWYFNLFHICAVTLPFAKLGKIVRIFSEGYIFSTNHKEERMYLGLSLVKQKTTLADKTTPAWHLNSKIFRSRSWRRIKGSCRQVWAPIMLYQQVTVFLLIVWVHLFLFVLVGSNTSSVESCCTGTRAVSPSLPAHSFGKAASPLRVWITGFCYLSAVMSWEVWMKLANWKQFWKSQNGNTAA